MPAVLIGSTHECLTLDPEPSIGPPERLTATLLLDGLSASRVVINHYVSGFRDLAEFFGGLERDWRGWPDVRSWESLEGGLRIDARHESGNVHLTVALRRDGPGWGNNGWDVTGDLTIEPGEQLSQAARDVAEMAAGG